MHIAHVDDCPPLLGEMHIPLRAGSCPLGDDSRGNSEIVRVRRMTGERNKRQYGLMSEDNRVTERANIDGTVGMGWIDNIRSEGKGSIGMVETSP